MDTKQADAIKKINEALDLLRHQVLGWRETLHVILFLCNIPSHLVTLFMLESINYHSSPAIVDFPQSWVAIQLILMAYLMG